MYANGQYGIVSEGTNNTIQNNSVKGVKPSGDGDLNALTWFGNGTKILFNDFSDFVEGDPGASHTDACQTWVSASHPAASSDVEIRGNRFSGPDNPTRDPKVPCIHQCIMAEDFGRGGNTGGSASGMKNWKITGNYFKGSWNQEIKLDGVDNVEISGNTFAGSSDKIVDLPEGSVKFASDNVITGKYGSIGVPVDGTTPPPPPPVTDPPPVATYPAQVLDLANWKLTLPVKDPAKASPQEIKQPDLAKFVNTDWFKVVGDGVAFRAAVNGYTTSGSSYPRSELREMNSDGSQASWASNDGKVHTLTVTEAFNHLPNGKPHLVGAQIHDPNDDICVFRLEGSNLYVTNGNDTHAFLADANYVLGTKYEAKFVVASGKVQAYYNGKLVGTITKDFSGAYFKAGAYTQANATNSSPADATNYGETIVYSVEVTHSVGSEPPPVTPPQANQPVVMIIRHGEKPSDKNDHTLSAQGQQRAAALPSIFVTPKAGLFKPTWIFASKGATSSMRMLQTAQPTADALQLPIDTRYDSENAVAETAKLLADQAKAGKVVLAVLEHSALPAVAKALGKSSPSVPSTWPDDRFDEVWVFVGDGKGGWTFTQVPELVLSGDKSTPI